MHMSVPLRVPPGRDLAPVGIADILVADDRADAWRLAPGTDDPAALRAFSVWRSTFEAVADLGDPVTFATLLRTAAQVSGTDGPAAHAYRMLDDGAACTLSETVAALLHIELELAVRSRQRIVAAVDTRYGQCVAAWLVGEQVSDGGPVAGASGLSFDAADPPVVGWRVDAHVGLAAVAADGSERRLVGEVGRDLAWSTRAALEVRVTAGTFASLWGWQLERCNEALDLAAGHTTGARLYIRGPHQPAWWAPAV